MAAVRFQGPCARRAPSSARSAGGGAQAEGRSTPFTQSGGRAGDPCAGPAGPGLHLAGGGVRAALRLHVLGGRRSHGLGSRGKGRATWRVVPTPPALNEV